MTDTLTVDQWRETIATTEGLADLTVPLDGTGGLTVFSLPSGWNLGLKDKDDTDLTDAKMRVGDDEYTLTKGAILSVTGAVGIPATYVHKTPGPMIQSHINYWATHSPETMLKFLIRGSEAGPEALAVTKEGITPFSNVALLDKTLSAIHARLGTADSVLLVDPKSHHDLRVTSLRLVVPQASRTIRADDWQAGVQIRNSLIGKVPLSVQGYLFCESGSEGVITQHAGGKWNRKILGQNFSDVLDWVGTVTDSVFDAAEHEFDTVEAVADESLGDSVSKVLADIFRTYKVPLRVRNTVMDTLVASEDLTYYGVLRALSGAANNPDLPEHFVTALMEIAGDVAHSASARCGSCKRVMV